MMDFRGVPFGGDGSLEIVLAVVAAWIVVYVGFSVRKAITGRKFASNDVGAVTFSVGIYILSAIFLAAAAAVAAFLVAGVLVLVYGYFTGQVFDALRGIYAAAFGAAWVIVACSILWWLARDA